MERKGDFISIYSKSIIYLFAVVFMLNQSVFAQGSFKKDIYDSFLEGRMDKWGETITAYDIGPDDYKEIWSLYHVTLAQYGYIAYNLGLEEKDKAEKMLEKAEENVDYMLNKYPSWSEVHALKGALFGFRIALNPMKSVYLGRKSLNSIKKALELDEDDPAGWVESGNAWYYMPDMFGGSPEKALGKYTKAVELFEANQQKLKYNWLYLNTLTLVAKCYEDMEEYDMADLTYQKILLIEPDFSWVKDELYPKFKERNEV